jgi:dephospho-CoA kinase
LVRVGLTGGIACGKTTVARMFAERGAHVIFADEIAHQLLRPGQEVYRQVVEAFGRGILREDLSIDRAKLADAAFGSGRIRELNGIVHPGVIERQEAWMAERAQSDAKGIAIVEAALLMEAGVLRRFDKLVVVTCTPEQKVARFAERHKIPLEAARAEVERRSATQIADEQKIEASDFVIDNSSTLEETAFQVDKAFAELKKAAG